MDLPAIDEAAPTTDGAPIDTAPTTSIGESLAEGPLPLTPTTTPPAPPLSTTTTTTATTTTTTVPPPADPASDPAANAPADAPAPEAPSPIRLEHAALLAAGVLALVGVRRRQRLRAAMPRHRVPEPREDIARTERTLRTIDAGERVLRADVACRAAARSLIGTGSQIGWVEVSPDGDLDLRLTAPAALPLPWTGDDQSWRLGAEVPIEILGDDARQVGQPCVALVQLGVTATGHELLVDLEACGVLAVAARSDQADEVVTAIAAALASSLFAEVAHLVAVSLPEAALLSHRSAHRTRHGRCRHRVGLHAGRYHGGQRAIVVRVAVAAHRRRGVGARRGAARFGRRRRRGLQCRRAAGGRPRRGRRRRRRTRERANGTGEAGRTCRRLEARRVRFVDRARPGGCQRVGPRADQRAARRCGPRARTARSGRRDPVGRRDERSQRRRGRRRRGTGSAVAIRSRGRTRSSSA